MYQVSFLYSSRETGSARLRDALAKLALSYNIKFWSDAKSVDNGFATELQEELDASDAVIHCVGPEGLGPYQTINEIKLTAQSLEKNPTQKLVIVLLGSAQLPTDLLALGVFHDRTTKLNLSLNGTEADEVLRAALPKAEPREDPEASGFARDIVKKTQKTGLQRSLTIVLGPYAFAEASESGATPAGAIRQLIRDNRLRGYAPWLDVMGSIARATETSDEDAAQAVVRALSPGPEAHPGSLRVYLRLLAANWARIAGNHRLFLVAGSPDLRLDTALRSVTIPVQHVRLVHCPREHGRLKGERIRDDHGKIDRDCIQQPDEALAPNDRVVLIKPFGCFEEPEKALLTAEHWRASSSEMMPLPSGIANQMTRSVLLVLGAGVFSPTLQILFSSLMRDALKRADNNANRYIVHNPDAKVCDPLHRIESALFADKQKRQMFEDWIKDNYGLWSKTLNSINFLMHLDYFLRNIDEAIA